VAPSDITEKNRNIGTQLQSILYTTAQKYFGKFTSYFGAHKLVRSEPFLDSRCEIWQLLPALYSEVRKDLYRCTSTFLALKYCDGLFWNLSDIYTKWCAQTFPPIFELFTILTAISRKLWRRPATEKWTMPSFWKGNDFLKKTLTTTSKSTHKPWHNSCSNYVPLSRRALRPRSVTKWHSDKHHIFAPTASARCTIFPKLCMVIEYKKVPIIFRSNW